MQSLVDNDMVVCTGCGDLHEFEDRHPYLCRKCHQEREHGKVERQLEDR